MTTTTQTHGGGAQPASIDTSGKATGGAALRVYGFDSEAGAIAAGYVCEGGPAMSVALITDAQLASGAWRLEGDPSGTAVYTAPSNMPVEGGFAVPVYPINGWGSAPAPAGPQFSAAEIGTVNASTVEVTFDQDVSASDYSAGVTIKVNGTATSITSATRQANHAIVYYVIPVLWHGSGDTVTWEYAIGSGNIVAESDSTPLGDVTAQSVTNNCEYAALLDLQADILALSDGDPVGIWADQSGLGHDFTQTGDARPTKQTIGGKSAVVFDGVDDWMLGGNFADAPSTFTIFCIIRTQVNSDGDYILSKVESAAYHGWSYAVYGFSNGVATDGSNYYNITMDIVPSSSFALISSEILTPSSGHLYLNGDNSLESPDSQGTVTTYSNSSNVCIGKRNEARVDVTQFDCCALMLMIPAASATNRAALEARLAARYGITL